MYERNLCNLQRQVALRALQKPNQKLVFELPVKYCAGKCIAMRRIIWGGCVSCLTFRVEFIRMVWYFKIVENKRSLNICEQSWQVWLKYSGVGKTWRYKFESSAYFVSVRYRAEVCLSQILRIKQRRVCDSLRSKITWVQKLL